MTNPLRFTFTHGEPWPADRTFGTYDRASVTVVERRETCQDFLESGLDAVRKRCLTNFIKINSIFLARMVCWLLDDPRVEEVIVDTIPEGL